MAAALQTAQNTVMGQATPGMESGALTAGVTQANMAVAANGAAGAASVAYPAAGGPMAMSGLQAVFKQEAVRKALPAIIVLLTLVLFGSIYAWMQETPYRPLFPGMAESDQQAAMEVLKAANMKPQLDPTSGQLTVPSGRYHEARILLAGQGLPKAQSRGVLDSLKDQSAMTSSQFMEQARYSAAIEQELAKSIAQIGSIQSARVHLAQIKQSAFVRERTPVKASVVVVPYGGRAISANQVQAIVHLVASSIPYLSTDDVSVVDNVGNLLTRNPTESLLGLTAAQVTHKQQVEETYRNRIIQLLEPVVGEGNVRSQVSLEMNFTQVETTSEDFDVRKEGAKTRSEMLSEERSTSAPEAGGVPGALSNAPPADAAATTDTKSADESKGKDSKGQLNTKTTRNYELDKTIRHVKSPMGMIERVSVAVVIKDRVAPVSSEKESDKGAGKGGKGAPAADAGGYSKEEIERLQSLVKSAVGFSDDRNDTVTIIPAKFELPAADGSAIRWYENDMVVSSIKVGLATAVLIVILITVVRPLVKSYLPQPAIAPEILALAQQQHAALEAAAAAGPAGVGGGGSGEGAEGLEGAEAGEDGMAMAEGESLEEFKERLKKSAAPKKSSISSDMLDTANTYDDKVALVRMLVQEDSGRVANVLKNMLPA